MSFLLTWLIRFLLFRIPGVRVFAWAFGLILAFEVFLYIFAAMGLYAMAKRQNIRGAVLSWVPCLQLYVAGAIADGAAGRVFYRVLLPCLSAGVAATGICCALSLPPSAFLWAWISLGTAIVMLVFGFEALYRIYAQYTKAPAVFLVLSILFWFLAPVFVFLMRRSTPRPLTTAVRKW